MTARIRYVAGFKYQLAEDYSCRTPIVGHAIEGDDYALAPDGTLTVRRGYAWDGASGPTFDSPSSMRPSMVHDVFCSLMRAKRLDYDQWQDTVNELFKSQCIEDGMWPWRAKVWHAAVEFADAGNPAQGPDRAVLEAP